MNNKILEIKDLTVSFDTYAGEVQAVRGVSWYLDRKETIAIVGESGCGKTVSIQTVMGMNKGQARIKKGEVLFEGTDLIPLSVREMRKYQGDRLSIIFQDPFTYLNPTMTVGRQITEVYRKHRKVSRKAAEERAVEILRMISLPNPAENMKRFPHQLSGGMRQRIMIAMALICDPAVLFADEPTTALDVTVQAQIIDLMKDLKNKLETSIVLITHDMGVVANMADRIYVMYAGRIMEHGDASAVFHNPKHPYTRGLLDSVPRLDEKTKGELHSIPGTPPDLIAPPQGCPFAARCEHAMNICVRKMPPFMDFEEPGHYAACWMNHPACTAARTSGIAAGSGTGTTAEATGGTAGSGAGTAAEAPVRVAGSGAGTTADAPVRAAGSGAGAAAEASVGLAGAAGMASENPASAEEVTP